MFYSRKNRAGTINSEVYNRYLISIGRELVCLFVCLSYLFLLEKNHVWEIFSLFLFIMLIRFPTLSLFCDSRITGSHLKTGINWIRVETKNE